MIYDSGLLLGDFIDLWKLPGLIYCVRWTGGWSNLLYLVLNGSCFECLRHKHAEEAPAEEGERTEAGGKLPDHQDCSFPFPSASGSPVWGGTAAPARCSMPESQTNQRESARWAGGSCGEAAERSPAGFV